MSHGFEIHDEAFIPADSDQYKKNGDRYITLAEAEAELENKRNGQDVIKIIKPEMPQTRKL